MIVYEIKPRFTPEGFNMLAFSGVHDRLMRKPARSQALKGLRGTGEVHVEGGLVLDVNRSELNWESQQREHPIDALIDRQTALRLGDGSIGIPGQAFASAYTHEQGPPSEGVVLVLCSDRDWSIARDSGELIWEPLPALRPLHDDSTIVDHHVTAPGSYTTADLRGIVLNYEREFDHFDIDFDPLVAEQLCDEEISPFIIELAVQHAQRSIDVIEAAKSVDMLSDPTTSRELRSVALSRLRSVQLRLAARGISSLIETRDWQSFKNHDEHRLQLITRRLGARSDRELSEKFLAFQPVLEAAESELRNQDAERAATIDNEKDVRIKRLTGLASAVLGGAALIGLFAALAALPGDASNVFSPYIRAAFATLTFGAMVAGYAWLLGWVLHRTPPQFTRVLLRAGGFVLLALGVGAAVIGWSWEEASSLWLLAISMFFVMAGVLALTAAYDTGSQNTMRTTT